MRGRGLYRGCIWPGGVWGYIEGQLIRVTLAIETATNSNCGVGFAIPAEIINRVVPALVQSGSFQHPWPGIGGTELTASLAKAMNLKPGQQASLVMEENSPGLQTVGWGRLGAFNRILKLL